MELNRDIMKSINKVAHQLAHQQYTDHRNALAAKCKAMLAGGKTRTEIDDYLAEISAGQNHVK